MRRYDIDWLRVIAIGLLLIYHIAIIFQPWGVYIGFIQSEESMESLWIPMAAMNVWRIPLLFFVSGMGVSFAMKKRNWKQLIGERALRIEVPHIVGILLIVPLHVFVYQRFHGIEYMYLPNPGHLWFLGNIFIYVAVLAPFFYLMKNYKEGRFHKLLLKIYRNPLGILLVALPILLETLVVNPETYEFYAMTGHGFWLGLICFFFGFTFIYAGQTFWPTVKKWKWIFLAGGLVFFLVRLLVFELEGPHYLLPVETVLWVIGLFGIGHAYLNKPGKLLTYLSEAAYPVYIFHMFWLYLGAYFILPLAIPVFWQFVLINLFTAIGSMFTYEAVKRVKVIRVLFGLRWNRKPVTETNAQVAIG